MSIEIIEDYCRNYLGLTKQKFNLLLTDPPYGNVCNAEYDKIADYAKFTESWLPLVKPVLTKNASLYIWCSIGPKSSSLWVNIIKENIYE